MRKTIKTYFKLFVFLFGITLLLVNCDKDEILEETNEIIQKPQSSEIKIERVPFSVLEARNSLGESMVLIDRYLDENEQNNNIYSRSVENGFTILTDEVLVATKDDVVTYTFQVESMEGIDGFRNFVINKLPTHSEYYLLYYTENQDLSNATNTLYSFDILNEEDLILNDINIQSREGEGSIGDVGLDPEDVTTSEGGGGNGGCETITYGACNNGGYHDGARWCQHSGGIHGPDNCSSLCSGPLTWTIDLSDCQVDYDGPNISTPTPSDPVDNSPNTGGGGSTTPIRDGIINTVPTPPHNEDGSSAAPESLISILDITEPCQLNWINDNANINSVENIWVFGQTNNWSADAQNSMNLAVEAFCSGTLEEQEFALAFIEGDLDEYYANHPDEFVFEYNLALAPGLDITKIMKCFTDALSSDPAIPNRAEFKLTVHVEQPNPGTRDTYKNRWNGPDPGHTFVTLKMNDSISSTSISQSFGFYPSALVDPSSSNPSILGKWKNNGNYTTNISISQDLNLTGFTDIINFVNSQSNATYNLNTFNCTDMAIQIAAQGGLTLPDTTGTWGVLGVTVGSGTNPGDLGEDIRDLLPNSNININNNTSSPSNGECP